MITNAVIKTHSERVQLCPSWKYCGDAADIDLYRAEIAELRAALAEPAKECGNCFEGKSDMDHACRTCGGTGVVTTPAKEAASATGAEQELLPILADWLNIIHDNELSLGDRLQRLSVKIQAITRGEAADKYRPHDIREQCQCALDYERTLESHRKLVRKLDVLLNGEEGAAKQASLCDIVAQVARGGIKAATPAQATPEGAELPALPRAYGYLTGRNLDMESSLEAAQAVCDRDNAAERELQACSQIYADPEWEPAKPEPLFDADQMRAYARAALAAQQKPRIVTKENAAAFLEEKLWEFIDTAGNFSGAKPDDRTWEHVLVYMPVHLKASQQVAEPVYQCAGHWAGYWVDVSKEAMDANSKAGVPVRTMYRAAPPQQVDTGGLPR